ncbi:amino acid transporter [Cristinia sonorae]|uniref:Amino acid transporter n=1 Tax=Cristinia sonorae TaxID=1940300 RepID=A0A8K0UF26_9AGAR|nr:amino acid transporter [Cristinia sonorae]
MGRVSPTVSAMSSLTEKPPTPGSSLHVESNPTVVDTSDKRLHELGYQSEFKREMSLFGVLGVSFCAIGILTGMSSAFQAGLFSGGPLGLFWGWNICSVFMLLIALSLAEICSAYPTMGGLYFLGWVYSIAMIFTGTSGNLSAALYLSSIIELYRSKPLTRVEIAAIAWATNILSGIINTFGTKAIGRMSSFNMWWTLGGTLVLVVTLLVVTPVKNDAKFVFTNYQNFTGWSSRGFVVLLGFLQAVYTLEGCETAAQLAEETTRAEILAPLAIVFSIVGSYVIGIAYLVTLLFTLQSPTSIQTTAFAIPIAQLYFDALKENRRLVVMCLFVVGLSQFMAAITAFTASSRLLYALARDNAAGRSGVKGSLLELNRFQAPWVGVWASVLVGCIVSCAYIGSTIAFNAILSSAAISVMLSYLQPIIIRVFWPSALNEKGPFSLGAWSWTINVACFMFTLFICVLFILPTAHPVTAQNMNYAIVAVGTLVMVVICGWFIWGRGTFRGSIVSTSDGPGKPNERSPPGNEDPEATAEAEYVGECDGV